MKAKNADGSATATSIPTGVAVAATFRSAREHEAADDLGYSPAGQGAVGEAGRLDARPDDYNYT